jgi:hypothetical protein
MTLRLWALLACLVMSAGCDDDPSSSADAAATGGTGGAGGGAGTGGTGGATLPPVRREAVAGHLTFAAGGHLFSAEVTGSLVQRLTDEVGPWTHHAVGLDARRIVAVQAPEGADRSVWIIDIRAQTTTRVSPEGCDAGIGGAGWLDDFRVMYAMTCSDDPSHLYVASVATENPTLADLFRVDDHPEAARDVFTAVRTPIYTYVIDRTECQGGDCVTKPEVWVAELDGQRCRLTDGDPAMVQAPGARLGDHAPAFDDTLTHVVFSRNVAAEASGPDGHLDLWRVGFSVDALLRGQDCVDGATVNLSTTLLPDDTYPVPGGAAFGSERWPDVAAGRGPEGSILFTSEAGGVRQVWVVDPGGNRTLLSPDTQDAGPARWIVDTYNLGG